ncbi:hypothetical protein B0H14DRAFT_2843303, partial [Mycena olivaceomarginata]
MVAGIRQSHGPNAREIATSLVRARLLRRATGTTPDAVGISTCAPCSTCDAAVVGAAPQRLRICVLPRSVDADVPGAPAPFWIGVLVARVLRTHPARTPGPEYEPLGTAGSAPLNVAPEPARFQSSASSTCGVHARCSSHPAPTPALVSHHLCTRARRPRRDCVRGRSRTGTI